MKKILVAAALAALASNANALSVAGSFHDMSAAGGVHAGGNLNVCTYCHAAHLFVASNIANATTRAPLWNRNWGTAPTSVVPYTSLTFSQNLTSASIGTATVLCLSCHDGATTMQAVNNGGPSVAVGGGRLVGGLVTGSANVGVNLRDDHPVGLSYSLAFAAGGLVTWTNSSQVSVFPLYAGQMECSSCHDPHNNLNTNFLRQTVSTICTGCHTK